MKYLTRKYAILILSGLMAISLGFTSCEVDEEDPVKPKTLGEYRSEMIALLDAELDKVANTVQGYDKGDFRSVTYYEEYTNNYDSVLTIARMQMDDPDLTIAGVIEANIMISREGKPFNDEIFPTDRRPLQERIVYGDTLRVHTPIDTIPGAPREAHDRFIAALATAKYWRNLMTTIDRQVAAEVEILNEEIIIFENAIVE